MNEAEKPSTNPLVTQLRQAFLNIQEYATDIPTADDYKDALDSIFYECERALCVIADCSKPRD